MGQLTLLYIFPHGLRSSYESGHTLQLGSQSIGRFNVGLCELKSINLDDFYRIVAIENLIRWIVFVLN